MQNARQQYELIQFAWHHGFPLPKKRPAERNFELNFPPSFTEATGAPILFIVIPIVRRQPSSSFRDAKIGAILNTSSSRFDLSSLAVNNILKRWLSGVEFQELDYS